MDLIQFEINNDNYFKVPRYQNSIYDFENCLKKLIKEINKFIYYQCTYLNIIPPRITQDFSLEYNNNSFTKNKIENYLDKKEEQEEKIKSFYNKFYNALKILDNEELKYFTLVLYTKNQSHKEYGYLANMTDYETRVIRESTIIKLALALNIAVVK